MSIKCVLFDADGVVVKSEQFSTQYSRKFGISIEEMLPFFEAEMQDCIIGKKDLKEALEPYLKKRTPMSRYVTLLKKLPEKLRV